MGSVGEGEVQGKDGQGEAGVAETEDSGAIFQLAAGGRRVVVMVVMVVAGVAGWSISNGNFWTPRYATANFVSRGTLSASCSR